MGEIKEQTEVRIPDVMPSRAQNEAIAARKHRRTTPNALTVDSPIQIVSGPTNQSNHPTDASNRMVLMATRQFQRFPYYGANTLRG